MKVVFRRTGHVTVDGVNVGFCSGVVHKWQFKPLGKDIEGPFKNRLKIKDRAREHYQYILDQCGNR